MRSTIAIAVVAIWAGVLYWTIYGADECEDFPKVGETLIHHNGSEYIVSEPSRFGHCSYVWVRGPDGKVTQRSLGDFSPWI